MNSYVIVSDATLDLPVHIIEQFDIRVIPMGLDIDNVEFFHYPDERELSIEDFYSRIKTGAVSRTSQITPPIFTEVFTELLEQGKDIIYIAFSSGLSGTFSCAQLVVDSLAEKYPDRKIYCVDSLCASIGEGLLVYHAALKKQEGLTIDQLRAWVEENKFAARHWFTVKDLYYLKRGGRITSIEAIVGTALKIRPVLSTDAQGKLVVLSKIRGSRAELDFMVGKMEAEGNCLENQTVFIGHGDDIEQAQALEHLIRSKNLVKDVVITKIGPIIGTHTGPGMLALVYMGKKA